PKEEAYIPRGFFSPEDVLDFIQYAHYDALKSGFVGIRGSGEMEWSLKKIPGIERLIYYENRLNEILGRLNISLLCQYNETKFPEKTLLGVIYTHPDIILYGQKKDNPYYVRPDIFPERFDQYTISVYGQIRDRIFSQEFS
ncbi:MAG: MEDS domain-containing protein, partial [Candidatus Omnitrophica bacterium]|nr:MEDS domain-containing protein [Candidatus Omnitrophota bacterium]